MVMIVDVLGVQTANKVCKLVGLDTRSGEHGRTCVGIMQYISIFNRRVLWVAAHKLVKSLVILTCIIVFWLSTIQNYTEYKY
jgi:hypothetical protein